MGLLRFSKVCFAVPPLSWAFQRDLLNGGIDLIQASSEFSASFVEHNMNILLIFELHCKVDAAEGK